MKKTIFAVALALIALLLLCGAALAASDFTVRNGVLTKYNGPGGDVVIPSNLGIKKIGNYAFAKIDSEGYLVENPTIKNVSIPDSVTSIGKRAFFNCSSLTSINIPDSVTSIDEWAFGYCSSLTTISIPDSVISIGTWAFYNCPSLTTISIPNGVTSIGAEAFGYCSSLTSISIPDKVTSIGERAFESCTSLTTINIPGGVTSIGDCAFMFCTSLTTISIPDGVTSIGERTFEWCSSLTTISIPESVTSIGNAAFCDCPSLTSIDLPDGVTSIGAGTFGGCSSLTTISIPDGVASIGDEAFISCDDLSSITLPESVTSIGNHALANCSSGFRIYIPASATDFGGPYSDGPFDEDDHPVIYCVQGSRADLWAEEKGYERVYVGGAGDVSPVLSVPEHGEWEDGVGYLPYALDVFTDAPVASPVDVFPAVRRGDVSYESADAGVAVVEGGVVKGVSQGSTTVTATLGDQSVSFTVRVHKPLESFELSETEIYTYSRKKIQLECLELSPQDYDGGFGYNSSNYDCAEVDKDGLVTIVGAGDALIVVHSRGVYRTCAIHACTPVTSVALDRHELETRAGQTAQLAATVTTQDKTYINRLVSFASSDEEIATVTDSGVVTALRPGFCTIRVSGNGYEDSCRVTVHAEKSVELPESLSEIAENAFENSAVEEVIVPESCTKIGAQAFKDSALKLIFIKNENCEIAEDAFEGCEPIIVKGNE